MKSSARPGGLVALLTDFGSSDPFVGIMKGVILSRCPDARIVDLVHGLPPQDVTAAALALSGSVEYFPEGTLFVCVVDPGVGTRRRIVYAEAAGRRFLAPDNGLLSWVLPAGARAREVARRSFFLPKVSSTFHGRDIFAPVAGALAAGLSPETLGPVARSLARLPAPRAVRKRGGLRGTVLAIDRFGNAVTSLRPADVARRRLRFAGRDLGPLRPTYAAVSAGAPLAVPGSYGFVELSVREGDFAREFGARRGDHVHAIR